MISLSMAEIDNYELFDSITGKKRITSREKLDPYKSKIRGRYALYYKNNLDSILPTGEWDEVKTLLISCYGNNVGLDRAKEEIRNALIKEMKNKCPFCMINRSNTFDHYFDKDDYPEFSIFTPNLIPCCSECNSKKGTRIFDANGERLFIHFYYDVIPIKQFLFIRLHLDNDNTPISTISLQFCNDNYSSKLIRRHYLSLELIDKYKSCVTEKISTLIEEIVLSRDKLNQSVEQIKDMIYIKWQSKIKIYGENYWESSLLEGVLNSENFIESIYVRY